MYRNSNSMNLFRVTKFWIGVSHKARYWALCFKHNYHHWKSHIKITVGRTNLTHVDECKDLELIIDNKLRFKSLATYASYVKEFGILYLGRKLVFNVDIIKKLSNLKILDCNTYFGFFKPNLKCKRGSTVYLCSFTI